MATVIELDGKTPRVADDAFIAPTAVLIGDVTVEPGASIWFGAVLRGDNSSIRVGAGSCVQDNCVIHCATELPTIIGENVTVGRSSAQWTTQLSCTHEPAPTRICELSPRRTAPNHTLALSSITTSPISTAVGAM